MKKVFSFSLFGAKEKYWRGLLQNISLIHKYFPEWYIYVWIGDGVPEDVILQIADEKKVVLLPTNQSGYINMFYRFFSIDEPDVEIMCVRDADSRIYQRDRGCIEQFVESDSLFHIIRDHPGHNHLIMGGMWGIKKEYLNMKIQEMFTLWKETRSSDNFWDDMNFLKAYFYLNAIPYSMIHDELHTFEPLEWITPFRVPLDDKKQHFIGQVYEFDASGNEVPMMSYSEG